MACARSSLTRPPPPSSPSCHQCAPARPGLPKLGCVPSIYAPPSPDSLTPPPPQLLSDPTENTQQLTQQLRALGLYAADTLGDGNCLFRALSDQLYGTPSYHLTLRQDVCVWIAAHKARYEPFVEDERGFDVHLQCMRQQGPPTFSPLSEFQLKLHSGTYGGHLELSAFAHYARRDVKVMQPGLVYVIEWSAGWDPSEIAATPGPSFEEPPSPVDSREKRRIKRDKVRADQEKIEHPRADTPVPQRPIYVA